MKIAIVIVALAFASSAFAQVPATESKHDKDVRECAEQGELAGDEAVKKAVVESPADVMRIKLAAKRFAISACMRGRGHASPPIREK